MDNPRPASAVARAARVRNRPPGGRDGGAVDRAVDDRHGTVAGKR
ncbi:MAG TPA: hypothetical protein VFR35_01350 [Actinoplanes sp.]|nr:hypothetical protein [Actinoplanes sp.]